MSRLRMLFYILSICLAAKLCAVTWSTPTQLSSGDGLFPCVTVDQAGVTLAVWADANGVYASTLTPATQTWSAPTTITTSYTIATIQDIALATNHSADSVVVLTVANGTNYTAVGFKNFSPGSWVETSIISLTEPVGEIVPIQGLVIDGSGNALVVILQNAETPTSYPLPSGSTTWGTAKTVFNGGETNTGTNILAIDRTSGAVWAAGSNAVDVAVVTIASPYSGSWSTTVVEDTPGGYTDTIIGVAANENGDLGALWTRAAALPIFPTTNVLYASIYDHNTTTWSTPVAVYTPPSTSVLIQNGAIGIDNSGNCLFVWNEKDSGSIQTVHGGRLSFPGMTSSNQQTTQISQNVTIANTPILSVDQPTGYAVAAWTALPASGSNYLVHTTFYNPQTDWFTPPTQISDPSVNVNTQFANSFPAIAVANNGTNAYGAAIWGLYSEFFSGVNGYVGPIRAVSYFTNNLPTGTAPLSMIGGVVITAPATLGVRQGSVITSPTSKYYLNKLSWPASDFSLNGISQYIVYKNGLQIGVVPFVPGTKNYVYQDKNITPGIPTNYTVVAQDLAGYLSGQITAFIN